MEKLIAPGSWEETFGEVILHGKIVGDFIIDWSANHQIVVGTNKNATSCDMSSLIGGEERTDIGFMIEKIPTSKNTVNYDVGISKLLAEFESVCSQSSNIKAFPNYDVYKVFLDPALYGDKLSEFKGCKRLQFSSPYSNTYSRDNLMALLTLDYSLVVYQQVSAGNRLQWKRFCSLTESLVKHLQMNNGFLAEQPIREKFSEFESMRDKKYSASLKCFSWSDVYDFQGAQHCFLSAASLNGFVIIWKFSLPTKRDEFPKIIHVFNTNWSDIANVAWLSNFDGTNLCETDDPFLMGLSVSSTSGLIQCYQWKIDDCVTSAWKCTHQNIAWNEADRLTPRKMVWIKTEHGSLLLSAKSHVLIALELDEQMNITGESVLDNVHAMPVVDMQIEEVTEDVQFISCSSDGLICRISCVTSPDLLLKLRDRIGKASGIGSFNVICPTTLHAISISPNVAFLAMVTSRPHVRLSIEVDNQASISMKRLITSHEAAGKLFQVVLADDNSKGLYDCLDVIEIIRQHHVMSRKFDPVITEFLSSANAIEERNIRKLQLRWYILKIKERTHRSRQKITSLDCVSTDSADNDELKITEEALAVLQIIKVLRVWFNHSSDDRAESLPIPVVALVELLKAREHYLSEDDKKLLSLVKALPLYQKLPSRLVCCITGLPLELSADLKTAVTHDGSSWPVCCLSFTALQGFMKRKCELSGTFASLPHQDNPDWLNTILTSKCIYSDGPLL